MTLTLLLKRPKWLELLRSQERAAQAALFLLYGFIVSNSERKPMIGIYRRQCGPIPANEIHDIEDEWLGADQTERPSTAELILHYLARRHRLIERMASDLDKSNYNGMGTTRKEAKLDAAKNFSWDAETAMEQIDALAAMFSDGAPTDIDLERLFIEAVKLGKTFERLYVRRMEYWAMLGRRNAETQGNRRTGQLTGEWLERVMKAIHNRVQKGGRANSRASACADIAKQLRTGTFFEDGESIDFEGGTLEKLYRKWLSDSED